MLVAPGHFAGGTHVNLLGALVLTGAALSWSVGSIYTLKLPRPEHPSQFVAMQMIVAGCVLIGSGLVSGRGSGVRTGMP